MVGLNGIPAVVQCLAGRPGMGGMLGTSSLCNCNVTGKGYTHHWVESQR